MSERLAPPLEGTSATSPAENTMDGRRGSQSSTSSRTAVGSSENVDAAKPAPKEGADRGADGGRPVERAQTSVLASELHPREPFSRLNIAQYYAERSAPGPAPKATDALGSNVKRTESGMQLGWDEGDPRNPMNWSRRRRWLITAMASLLTVNVTFASSAPSFTVEVISREFGFSVEKAELITTLFLLGYVAGPFIWAPGSEIFGRQPIFIFSIGTYMLFQMGPALAQNQATLWSTRFLGGLFAAAPLTNAGGLIADIWSPVDRGAAMSLFTVSVFIGPVMGPIVGGFVTSSYLGWRWVFWLQMIFAAACWVPCCFLIPETYSPVLLQKRAKELRSLHPEMTELYAPLEHSDMSAKGLLKRTLYKPFHMLALEPILILVTFYLSLVYAILYMTFSVFPLIWEEGQGVRNFNPGETGLVFIGVGLGAVLGGILNVYLSKPYRHLTPKWRGTPPPEHRLYGAMFAGPSLAIGLFWIGWTGAFAAVPWYVPALATIPLGFSFSLIFLSFLPFLIDCYAQHAASALAANTICRSALAAVAPLFVDYMYKGLSIQWASSLLGFVALVLAPSPFLFFRHGHRIRGSSKFAPAPDLKIRDEVLQQEREEKEKKSGKKAPESA